MARAMQDRVVIHGEQSEPHFGAPMFLYTLKQDAGIVMVAENRSDRLFTVELDCNGSFNMVSARGALVTKDTLVPGTRQVLQVLSTIEGSGYQYQCQMRYLAEAAVGLGLMEAHEPPLERSPAADLFLPLPCR